MMRQKKTISLSIPCYNEEGNVTKLTENIIKLFDSQLPQYNYFIQFIDNHSTDNTRALLRELCGKYSQVRVIFNARNFPKTSGYYGLIQSEGDCTISIPSDFQVPLDTIPKMIEKWEMGAKIVCLVKSESKERKSMWGIRQLFYAMSNKFSDTEILRNFTGSGLYDRKFLDICRQINDPVVSFMNIISTCGFGIVTLPYIHVRRGSGKSKHHLWSLIDLAITRYTNASTIGLRFATVFGAIISFFCIIIGIVYLVLKLLFWDMFPAGTAPLLIGVFFIGSLQLFFIGLLGEYVIKANVRLMNRPLVVEDERINFDIGDSKGHNSNV